MWVERSGSSIDYLDGLIDTFPGARFVHLHRDGPEAARIGRGPPLSPLGVAPVEEQPLHDGDEKRAQAAALLELPEDGVIVVEQAEARP